MFYPSVASVSPSALIQASCSARDIDPCFPYPFYRRPSLFIRLQKDFRTYLLDAYGPPENRLFPTGVRERARCLEWCFFVISELAATSLYVMRRHRVLRHIYGEAPLANEAASAYFQKQMRAVGRALEKGPAYILGDRFTAADILLSTCITWAVRYGVPVADSVLAYNGRVTARASHGRAVKINTPPAGTVRV